MFVKIWKKRAFNFRRLSTSGDVTEHAQGLVEVEKWKKYSAGMLMLSLVAVLYNVLTGSFTHHPHQIKTDMDYLHVRNKPYPWKCADCNLLDLECKRKCKEELNKSEQAKKNQGKR